MDTTLFVLTDDETYARVQWIYESQGRIRAIKALIDACHSSICDSLFTVDTLARDYGWLAPRERDVVREPSIIDVLTFTSTSTGEICRRVVRWVDGNGLPPYFDYNDSNRVRHALAFRIAGRLCSDLQVVRRELRRYYPEICSRGGK